MKNSISRPLISIICALVILTGIFVMPASAEEATANDMLTVSGEGVNFIDYLASFDKVNVPSAAVTVFSGENTLLLGERDAYKTAVIAEEGIYALSLGYKITQSGEDTAFAVKINGKTPYYEASSIGLGRVFYDEYGVEGDIITDDIIPEQIPVDDFRQTLAFDTVGYYGDCLLFRLSEGENDIELSLVSGSVEFSFISFVPEFDLPEYERPADLDSEIYSGAPIYFEAERMSIKTDSSILAVSDVSSAAVSPISPYEKYLNVVGGSNFQKTGQAVQWKFTVPKTGYYNLTVKYRQEKNVGMNSYRRIEIDGEVPFAELSAYPFPYTVNFKNETLKANGENIYFYLTEGEHTLSMQVVIGELSEILPAVNTIAGKLTEAYRRIIMITGATPDSLRDYLLDNSIPETIALLKEQNAALKEINEKLESVGKSSSSASKVIGTLCDQLDYFEKDSYYITQNLASFKSNVSALSTWLLEAKTGPLKLDYFAVHSDENALRSAKSGFFETVAYYIKSFIYTFSADYMGRGVGAAANEKISVWVTGNSTKFAILDRLVKGDFEKKNPGVSVELKLVTANLATAILAGKNPDIALEHNSTEIMNLVYRNSVVAVSDFADYDTVRSRFRDCSEVPLSWDGKVFALPSTQTYSILYYRTDVFSELGLEKPTTWDDVIYVLSELKKNNLEFGIPHTMEVFSSMLYQRGGQLYNTERTATDLKTGEAIDAFTTFTSLFTDYSAPLAFNAQNRFRTGEMPILIGNIDFYNTLKVLAPEIEGKWDVLPYPGTASENGNSTAQVTIVTGDVIISKEKADPCWEFLKWKTSTEVQIELSRNYEMVLGRSERLMSANTEAFRMLGWNDEMTELIDNTEAALVGIPAVPGSYYMNRHVNNAIAAVIYRNEIPGDALQRYAKVIDAEIAYKIKWFDLDK